LPALSNRFNSHLVHRPAVNLERHIRKVWIMADPLAASAWSRTSSEKSMIALNGAPQFVAHILPPLSTLIAHFQVNVERGL
jgi:hypothetical protein